MYYFDTVSNCDIRYIAQGFYPNNIFFELVVDITTFLEIVDSTIP